MNLQVLEARDNILTELHPLVVCLFVCLFICLFIVCFSVRSDVCLNLYNLTWVATRLSIWYVT